MRYVGSVQKAHLEIEKERGGLTRNRVPDEFHKLKSGVITASI